MKKTDLEKAKALKLMGNLKARVPARFGNPGEVQSRRERRAEEQKLGLIPFAVKLDQTLVQSVRDLAKAKSTSVDAVVGELLQSALEKV